MVYRSPFASDLQRPISPLEPRCLLEQTLNSVWRHPLPCPVSSSFPGERSVDRYIPANEVPCRSPSSLDGDLVFALSFFPSVSYPVPLVVWIAGVLFLFCER